MSYKLVSVCVCVWCVCVFLFRVASSVVGQGYSNNLPFVLLVLSYSK